MVDTLKMAVMWWTSSLSGGYMMDCGEENSCTKYPNGRIFVNGEERRNVEEKFCHRLG